MTELLTPQEIAKPRQLYEAPYHSAARKKHLQKQREIWTPYILKPDIEFFHVDENNDRESHEGIYGLFDHTGFLLYIGKSMGTRYRITQHHWARDRGAQAYFTYCAVMPVPAIIMGDIEVAHIHALRPVANNLFERVRCDWHDDMVKAIREIWEVPSDE